MQTIPGKNVSYLSIFIFGFFLFFASADTFQYNWGYPGMIAYAAVILGGLVISHKFILPWIMPKMTDRHGLILGAIALVILFVVFMYLFPIADRRSELGLGSDGDDALNVAAREMMAGRFPYYPLTYLGNEILPFPGAVFLALPFIIIGNSAYQVFLWLIVYFFLARYLFKSSVDAFFLMATMIVLSVVFMQNITTGTDRVPNTIFVLFFMWWMVHSISDNDAPLWKKLLPSVLAGFAFASRSNYLPLTPLLFSILWQTAGWKEAVKYCAIVGLVFLALVVPFWLYDPAGFAPIHIQYQKVRQFEQVLPHSGIITPLATLLIAAALSFQRMTKDYIIFLRNCAIVQLFPILFSTILVSIKGGHVDMMFSQYGIFSLLFIAIPLWWHLVYGRPYWGSDAEPELPARDLEGSPA